MDLLKAHMTTTAATAAAVEDTKPLPPKLTIPYLLGLEPNQDEEDPAAAAVETNVTKFLSDNGVIVTETDTAEDKATAAKRLSSGRFWQRHFSLHPHQNRVKTWCWIHDRYRHQILELQHKVNASTTATEAAAALHAFEKFHSKIEAHSEFEDTQLFKYFIDHKQESGANEGKLATLMKQHENIRFADRVRHALQECSSSSHNDGDAAAAASKKEECINSMQEYVDDLKAHLDLEECTLVKPWLQLTDEQYKKYRSYLSWKYCFMY